MAKSKIKKDNKEYITKTICFKNVNKGKFEKIKKYVEEVLIEKNNVVENTSITDKFLIYKNKLGKYDFDKKYQSLEQVNKELSKTDIQEARFDTFVKLKNMFNACEFKSVKTKINKNYRKNRLKNPNVKSFKNEEWDSDLYNLISYICKQIVYIDYIPEKDVCRKEIEINLINTELRDKKILSYIDEKAKKAKSQNSMYKKWIYLINKFSYERILTLSARKYLNVLNKKVAFKKLTISHKNTISSLKSQIGLNKNLKKFNAFLNFNIPKQEEITLLFRHNKNYHRDLKDLSISNTQKTKLDKYPSGYVQTQFKFTINVDTLYNQINIYYSLERSESNSYSNSKINLDLIDNYSNYVGIDVNVKNNILALSDGKTFKTNSILIKKCIRFDKQRKLCQSNKQLNHNPRPYGKKMLLKINKNNRRSKWYLEQVVNELINYCKEKNYNHIVMENLNLKDTKTFAKDENGINYNRIVSLLHLNDIKNVIKRIADKNDIMVSWVNPKYTSQQCPICGHISKNNRPTQEIFCCEKCFHNENADVNAAINIKNRVEIKQYRKELMKLDKDFKGYKGKIYVKKEEYIDLVKNLKNNPNKKNFGYDGIVEWLKLDV